MRLGAYMWSRPGGRLASVAPKPLAEDSQIEPSGVSWGQRRGLLSIPPWRCRPLCLYSSSLEPPSPGHVARWLWFFFIFLVPERYHSLPGLRFNVEISNYTYKGDENRVFLGGRQVGSEQLVHGRP
ncbi:hypothetical protein IF1G_05314 [Cordyceps javanica]|uniref:Uncharacterized protein n=1 Tax=Cordyceps javanica TaxID=43265 RepID=A0A545V181_9HYPO|nr:hypothetical protein IF1G_05314 [Cordyceps javanica]